MAHESPYIYSNFLGLIKRNVKQQNYDSIKSPFSMPWQEQSVEFVDLRFEVKSLSTKICSNLMVYFIDKLHMRKQRRRSAVQ